MIVARKNYFGVDLNYILNKLGQFFVLNFAWIIVLFLAILLIYKWYQRYKKNNQLMKSGFVDIKYSGLLGGMILFSVFSVFYITASLVRYNVLFSLSLTILFVIVFADVVNEKWGKGIYFILGIIIFIFLNQSYFDLDIVSNILFRVLDTGGLPKVYTDYNSSYYGDGLVNNYQYTWIDTLFDDMLRDVEYTEDMDVILPGFEASGTYINGNGNIYVIGWDEKNKKRIIIDDEIIEKNDNVTSISVKQTDDMFEKIPQRFKGFQQNIYDDLKNRAIVFFLPYYEEDEAYHLKNLGQYYYIGGRKHQKNIYGTIYYYNLLKKENYKGFCLSEFIDDGSMTILDTKQLSYQEYLYNNIKMQEYLDAPDKISRGDRIVFECKVYLNGMLLPERFTSTYYGKSRYSVIGSGNLIDGLEECFIGKSIGDTLKYKWKVTEEYLPANSYIGQILTIEVKIIDIEGYMDFEELSVEQMKNLEESYNVDCAKIIENRKILASIDGVNGNNKISFPLERIEKEETLIDSYLQHYFEKVGISEKDFIKKYLGCDEIEYREAVRKMAMAVVYKEVM